MQKFRALKKNRVKKIPKPPKAPQWNPTTRARGKAANVLGGEAPWSACLGHGKPLSANAKKKRRKTCSYHNGQKRKQEMKAMKDGQPYTALAEERRGQLTTQTWFENGRANRQKQFQ